MNKRSKNREGRVSYILDSGLKMTTCKQFDMSAAGSVCVLLCGAGGVAGRETRRKAADVTVEAGSGPPY